jgi:hypothetical protein
MRKPSELEMRLLMLGASVVKESPAMARIIADAMVELEKHREAKAKRKGKRVR